MEQLYLKNINAEIPSFPAFILLQISLIALEHVFVAVAACSGGQPNIPGLMKYIVPEGLAECCRG